MMEIKQTTPNFLEFKNIISTRSNGIVQPNNLIHSDEKNVEQICFSNDIDRPDEIISNSEKQKGGLSKVPVYDTDDLLNVLKDDTSDCILNVARDTNVDEVDSNVLANHDIDMLTEEFLNDIVAEDKSQDSEETFRLENSIATKTVSVEKDTMTKCIDNTNIDNPCNVQPESGAVDKIILKSDNLATNISQNTDELENLETKKEIGESDIIELAKLKSGSNETSDIQKGESIKEDKKNEAPKSSCIRTNIEIDISDLEKEIDNVSDSEFDTIDEKSLIYYDDDENDIADIGKNKAYTVKEDKNSNSFTIAEKAKQLRKKCTEEPCGQSSFKCVDNTAESSTMNLRQNTTIEQNSRELENGEADSEDFKSYKDKVSKTEVSFKQAFTIKSHKSEDVVDERNIGDSVDCNSKNVDSDSEISKVTNVLNEDARHTKTSKLYGNNTTNCDIINLDEEAKDDENPQSNDLLIVTKTETHLIKTKQDLEGFSEKTKDGKEDDAKCGEDNIVVLDSRSNSLDNIAEKSNEKDSSSQSADTTLKSSSDNDEEDDVMVVETKDSVKCTKQLTKDKGEQESNDKKIVDEEKNEPLNKQQENLIDDYEDDVVVLEDESPPVNVLNVSGSENESKLKQSADKSHNDQLDKAKDENEIQKLNKSREETKDVILHKNDSNNKQIINKNPNETVEKSAENTKNIVEGTKIDDIVLPESEIEEKKSPDKKISESKACNEVVKDLLKDLNYDESDDVIFVDNDAKNNESMELSQEKLLSNEENNIQKSNHQSNNDSNNKEHNEITNVVQSDGQSESVRREKRHQSIKEGRDSVNSDKDEISGDISESEKKEIETLVLDNSDNAQVKSLDKLSRQESKEDGVSSNNDEFSSNNDEISSNNDGISSNNDGVNSTIDGVSSNNDGVNSTIDGVNSTINGVNSTINGVSSNNDRASSSSDGVSSSNDGDNNLLTQIDSPQNSQSKDLFNDKAKELEIEKSEMGNSVEPPSKRLRMNTRQSERLRNSDSKDEHSDQNKCDTVESDDKKAIKRSVSSDTLLQDTKKRKVSSSEDNKEVKKKIDLKSENNKNLIDCIPKLSKRVSLPLHFLKKFKKSITKMTKEDLEELVLQKVAEAIVFKSEFSELRDLVEKQEKVLNTQRTKLAEVTKQFRDLEMVHNRVLQDLKTRNQDGILPVKITRAVGLQVMIPKRMDQNGNNKPIVPVNNTCLDPKARKILPKPTLPSPDDTQQTQNSVVRNTVQPSTITLLSGQQMQQPKGQQRVVTRSAVTTPPTPQQAIVSVNYQTTPPQYIIQQPSSMGPIISPQNTIIANQTARKSSPSTRQPQTPVQGLPAPQNSVDRPRVPPMILKKTGTNGRMLAIAAPPSVTPIATTSFQQNAPSANKSVIDLTNEDDDVSIPQANGPAVPALVAIPPQGQPAQVTYIVNKPGNVPQRVIVTQATSGMQRAANTKSNTQYMAIASKPSLMQSNNSGRKQPVRRHPAPLPKSPPALSNPGWKAPPPRPTIQINTSDNSVIISWTMDEISAEHAEITRYQIFAYQETLAPPNVEAWRHVGDVKAMVLPMSVTLKHFHAGQRYYFAVRAVDIHTRSGPFSLPKTWA